MSRGTLVLATANTGTFEFTTLARTRREADKQLRDGYATHVEQYAGRADPTLMDELIRDGEVQYVEVAVGDVLRDGEPL